MNSNSLQIGVLSCADIGLRAMVPAIQRAHNARVVAIASRDAERARRAAKAHDIPRAYDSYEALLDDPEVQAIYNPLPTALHAEWTIRAAERGKHVLVEKPIALNTDEVDAIRAAADAAKVTVMEALMYRLHPQTARVRELLAMGALGEVQLVTTAFTYHVPDSDNIRLSDALGGGVLLDVGSYCVNVARYMFGGEPELVFGSARIGPASDVDEVFAGVLRFSGGRQSVFDCSLHGPRQQWYIISGSEASLTVPVPFAPGTEERRLVVRRGWQRGKETEEVITIPGADQYQLLVEHFADCILNQAVPVLDLAESHANIAVLSALRQSARKNELISL